MDIKKSLPYIFLYVVIGCSVIGAIYFVANELSQPSAAPPDVPAQFTLAPTITSAPAGATDSEPTNTPSAVAATETKAPTETDSPALSATPLPTDTPTGSATPTVPPSATSPSPSLTPAPTSSGDETQILPGSYEAFDGVRFQTDVYTSGTPPKSTDEQDLLFHFYAPSTDNRSERPLIILSRLSRNNDTLKTMAQYLSDRGFAVAILDVRASPDDSWEAIEYSTSDIFAAVRYFKLNASQFKIDPNTIMIGGYSYGGFTSLTAAYDFESVNNKNDTNPGPSNDILAVISLAGGFPEKYAKLKGMAGPQQIIDIINPGEPPGIFFHGMNDETVPVEQAQWGFDALHLAGVYGEMYLYNANHELVARAGTDIANRIVTFFLTLTNGN